MTFKIGQEQLRTVDVSRDAKTLLGVKQKESSKALKPPGTVAIAGS